MHIDSTGKIVMNIDGLTKEDLDGAVAKFAEMLGQVLPEAKKYTAAEIDACRTRAAAAMAEYMVKTEVNNGRKTDVDKEIKEVTNMIEETLKISEEIDVKDFVKVFGKAL